MKVVYKFPREATYKDKLLLLTMVRLKVNKGLLSLCVCVCVCVCVYECGLVLIYDFHFPQGKSAFLSQQMSIMH